MEEIQRICEAEVIFEAEAIAEAKWEQALAAVEAIVQQSTPEQPRWYDFLITLFPTRDCRHGRCVRHGFLDTANMAF